MYLDIVDFFGNTLQVLFVRFKNCKMGTDYGVDESIDFLCLGIYCYRYSYRFLATHEVREVSDLNFDLDYY